VRRVSAAPAASTTLEEFFNALVAWSGRPRGRSTAGGFVEAARERVRAPLGALTAALEAEDVYATAVVQDELDAGLRVARRHGVDADELAAGEE
jgi:hypothetical protein